jgi:hypothetical protein
MATNARCQAHTQLLHAIAVGHKDSASAVDGLLGSKRCVAWLAAMGCAHTSRDRYQHMYVQEA